MDGYNVCMTKNDEYAFKVKAKYENPLKISEKNSMCWSKVNISNYWKK